MMSESEMVAAIAESWRPAWMHEHVDVIDRQRLLAREIDQHRRLGDTVTLWAHGQVLVLEPYG